jgi:coproporphyrinogen III oxidase-like Fe-S oxidoreductase
MQLATIVALIQTVIATAPYITDAVESVHQFVDSLYLGGNVSISDQKRLHEHIDAVQKAVTNGQTPPQWTVEANPKNAGTEFSI